MKIKLSCSVGRDDAQIMLWPTLVLQPLYSVSDVMKSAGASIGWWYWWISIAVFIRKSGFTPSRDNQQNPAS